MTAKKTTGKAKAKAKAKPKTKADATEAEFVEMPPGPWGAGGKVPLMSLEEAASSSLPPSLPLFPFGPPANIAQDHNLASSRLGSTDRHVELLRLVDPDATKWKVSLPRLRHWLASECEGYGSDLSGVEMSEILSLIEKWPPAQPGEGAKPADHLTWKNQNVIDFLGNLEPGKGLPGCALAALLSKLEGADVSEESVRQRVTTLRNLGYSILSSPNGYYIGNAPPRT